mmetsp:Transcript_11982/g.22247  ORF Transcript_11982/g.22247 Transcript_11982/m.22247 type:complete len:242 (-) Transcript_11982:169-894(-)|eukprot:CAMPEP_0201883546 /NCGR_PEP_ID=MMETSP0902-20130614/15964_1 /ASSEMBLY_ACC=CAM_ASM_000551 /TAXON_ID=420261 /ORGANISM="Thalassiosira antarctica, Strain CCMP982" /LENGTH=241 /DNA_ID=CAMNT_0048412365 /DNA_START=60 /DNA_END=785 /DNA_ORIENTATION=+
MTARRITIALLVAASTTGVAAFAPSSPAIHPTTQLSAANNENPTAASQLANAASVSILAATLLFNPLPSHADGGTKEFKLPPIDRSDASRCVLNSSKMGQANAARDKLYDLRECNLSGANANEFDLSGVIMTKTDASKAKFREAQFSKGYLRDSNFEDADFTNAIVDRASFKGSSMRGTIFQNAVLTATSFEGADVENADFTDSYIGDFDIKNLCKNPSLKGENPTTGADTRMSAQCSPGR